MEMILIISVIVCLGYLISFLYETKKYRAYNFFSLLICLFFTIFICVYIFIGNDPKNNETKIIKKSILTVNSNDSSGIFQNDTEKDLEIITLMIKTQSTRFGINNALEETKYLIEEKDSNK